MDYYEKAKQLVKDGDYMQAFEYSLQIKALPGIMTTDHHKKRIDIWTDMQKSLTTEIVLNDSGYTLETVFSISDLIKTEEQLMADNQ